MIRQNIAFSLGIKLVAVAAVFPGWLTLWLAILADMGATVLVTLNAARLLRHRPAAAGADQATRPQRGAAGAPPHLR